MEMTSSEPEIVHHPATGEATGAPVLIVPGAFSDADSFEAVAQWISGRGRSTHTVRLPHRSSRIPQVDRGGLAAVDAALDRACDKIGEPLVAFGHSLGGLAVLRLLSRRRLEGGILMMPVPPGGLGPDAIRLLRRRPLDAAKMLGLSFSAWPVRHLPGRPPRGMMSEGTPSEAIEASAERRKSESWRLLAQVMVGSRETPPPVDTPLLLAGGSQDSIVSPESVARLAGELHAPYLEFDVGHAFAEEPGFEIVLESVFGRLEDHGR